MSSAYLNSLNMRSIPASIAAEAEKRCQQRYKEQFKAYLKKQYAEVTNVILENLPSINGLPVSVYLNRMIGWNPYTKHGNTPLDSILDEQLMKLGENETSNPNEPSVSTLPDEKLYAARMIAQIAANPSERDALGRWLQSNVGALNENIANSMSVERRDLTEELCYCIAYLARIYRFEVQEKMDIVIASMVRTLATILIPWETYVEQYRDAKERHNDYELARGRSILFHFPRMEYQFNEVNHSLLAVIYYTLGDLLFNVPSPKLIHFFECRIFRRKEMTRNILFTILLVIATNLTELQCEAEKIFKAGHSKSVDLSSAPNIGPLTSRRGRAFNEAIWNELPGNLYADIIRVYSDRNRSNKVMINEIMALLRAQAPEKLPIFEEATLKALELYSGVGMGRSGETYQIGRNVGVGSTKDVDGAMNQGQRRRRSGVPHDQVQTAVKTSKELGTPSGTLSGTAGQTGPTDKTGEYLDFSTAKIRQSLDLTGPLTEKISEDRESDTSESSSNDDMYSYGSDKLIVDISRKTWIAPKIPDLLQTPRTRKRHGQV